MGRQLKLGAICRADNGGLGNQTYEFYKHMQPDKTLVVDISHLTGYQNDFSRYPGATIVQGFEIPENALVSFVEGLDVVFTVETPYNHELYPIARQKGCKTVCQYNYEWLANHETQLPLPDLLLAPSEWNRDKMPWPTEYLHVPVNRSTFPFRRRTKAKKFLHIAGHQAHGDRNGTALFMESISLIKHHDIELVIRTQEDLPRPYTDHRLKVVKDDIADYKDLYEGDVLVLPRRYGGLSLQLNEAMSLGMVPIMLNCSPQNQFLHPNLLVPARVQEQLRIKTFVDSYTCTPQELANKIDELCEADIGKYSDLSDAYASERDWAIMKPQYEQILASLCSPS